MPPRADSNDTSGSRCEQDAETPPSGLIPQKQPTYEVIHADMETSPFFFSSPLKLSETSVFLSAGANKASPDTGEQTKAVLVSQDRKHWADSVKWLSVLGSGFLGP